MPLKRLIIGFKIELYRFLKLKSFFIFYLIVYDCRLSQINMKITLPSFLLLFIFTTAINAQQKIGFKIILDQNFKYDDSYSFYNTGGIYGGYYDYYILNKKRISTSYGVTYEKVLSNKFLTSIETGLYLNTQSSSSSVNHKDYFL